MSRALRILVTAWAFFFFFAAGPLIGIFVLPWLHVVAKDRADYRRRCTRVLGRLHTLVAWWGRVAGLIEGPADVPELPAIARDRACLVIANHPSLIDVVLLLGAYDGLTCIVRRDWYRSFALGPLLRRSAYLPGPVRGRGGDEDVLASMVAHLGAGHSLLVFPEGARSLPDRMHRFRRGAVEAAVRAQVPIVALFLTTDRPFLTKGEPFWRVPDRAVRYELELLDVIDTRGIAVERARELNAELQRKYHERFELLRARHEAPSPQAG